MRKNIKLCRQFEISIYYFIVAIYSVPKHKKS